MFGILLRCTSYCLLWKLLMGILQSETTIYHSHLVFPYKFVSKLKVFSATKPLNVKCYLEIISILTNNLNWTFLITLQSNQWNVIEFNTRWIFIKQNNTSSLKDNSQNTLRTETCLRPNLFYERKWGSIRCLQLDSGWIFEWMNEWMNERMNECS